MQKLTTTLIGRKIYYKIRLYVASSLCNLEELAFYLCKSIQILHLIHRKNQGRHLRRKIMNQTTGACKSIYL